MLEAVYTEIYKRFQNGGLDAEQIDRFLKMKNINSEIPSVRLALDPRVEVIFYAKQGRWLFMVFRRNKNLSVSKGYDPDHFAITMAPEEVENVGAVAEQFSRWIINFEEQESVGDILSESNDFQNIIRKSLLRDKTKRMDESREARIAQTQAETEKNQMNWIWGFVIFLILGMIFLGSKGGGSSDCNWVSDPRGGYSDC